MNLYLLTNNISTGYDVMMSTVVRANSYKEARKIASELCCMEGPDIWIDPKKSSCKKLKQDGEEKMIICNFRAG